MSYAIDTFDFSGKRALIRVDFNVPLDENFNITDDTRMRAALRTIQKVSNDGGKVILMSHLGRPKGKIEKKYSLRHLLPHLSELLKKNVAFAEDCVGDRAMEVIHSLKDGDIALLENLRFYKEEEEGDEFFAGQLAELGDVYINDAFGTAHRAHASTAIIARFFPQAKFFGYLMEDEIKNIEKVLLHAAPPVTAIIGGSKISSKIVIIENLLDKVENLLIGGGMAFTFIKAQKGHTGNSLVEEDKIETALHLLHQAEKKGVRLYLPTDTVIADRFSADAAHQICDIHSIPDGWMGLDIGPKTIAQYQSVIHPSKTILWNGPMGVFEMEKFSHGTLAIAQALASATAAGCFTLIGGGDSVAAINQYHLSDKVSYVSTGGGAMLEYLEGKKLPGIAAIQE